MENVAVVEVQNNGLWTRGFVVEPRFSKKSGVLDGFVHLFGVGAFFAVEVWFGRFFAVEDWFGPPLEVPHVVE